MKKSEYFKKLTLYPKKVFKEKLDKVLLNEGHIIEGDDFDNERYVLYLRIYVDMPQDMLQTYDEQVKEYYNEKAKSKKFDIDAHLISSGVKSKSRVSRLCTQTLYENKNKLYGI